MSAGCCSGQMCVVDHWYSHMLITHQADASVIIDQTWVMWGFRFVLFHFNSFLYKQSNYSHSVCRQVTDGEVVRAGASVIWKVLSMSRSGGYEFETWSGQTWGVRYFCPKSYFNQKENNIFLDRPTACTVTKIWVRFHVP